MRVVVGCEASGCVRRAFERAGHDVVSCDLRPAADGASNHHQGDIFEFLDSFPVGWFDLAIYHAPCTYILQSGVRWLYVRGRKRNGRDEDRWEKMRKGALFFRYLHEHKAARRACSENPEMCSYALHLVNHPWAQHFGPFDFGHREKKEIYLWLRELPVIVPPPELYVGPPPKEGDPEYPKWAKVHYTGKRKGVDRGLERSAFYDGVADQFAAQWGHLA